MKKMLRLGEAAKYLGAAPTTLKRWANLGLCPSLKSPLGHSFWTKDMLDEIYKNMKEGEIEED